MDTNSLITLISVFVGSTGLSGGIYALLKLRPEAGQITVSAAQGAVIVQTGVIENLHKELARVREELENERKEKYELEDRLDTYRTRLRELEDKYEELHNRTIDLEAHQEMETHKKD